jgi:hypothetical protein
MKLRLPGDANETDAETGRLKRQAGTNGPDQSDAETGRLKRQAGTNGPDQSEVETEGLKRQSELRPS